MRARVLLVEGSTLLEQVTAISRKHRVTCLGHAAKPWCVVGKWPKRVPDAEMRQYFGLGPKISAPKEWFVRFQVLS